MYIEKNMAAVAIERGEIEMWLVVVKMESA